jgi:hypothetical protein
LESEFIDIVREVFGTVLAKLSRRTRLTGRIVGNPEVNLEIPSALRSRSAKAAFWEIASGAPLGQ